MNVHQPIPDAPMKEDDFFLMSNLRPKDTGLPMVVWVSHRGHARHDARVKVCRAHGDKLDIDDMAVVGVRPTPTLIDYWEGRIDTVEMLQSLKRL